MPKRPDLIAERAFFVNGKRNGGPAVVFRLWRPVFGGRLRWEASPEGGHGLGLPTIEDWPLRNKQTAWVLCR